MAVFASISDIVVGNCEENPRAGVFKIEKQRNKIILTTNLSGRERGNRGERSREIEVESEEIEEQEELEIGEQEE